MAEKFFDLYLYVVPESNKLTKIPHLSMEDAQKYAKQWFDINDLHDYMLVTEDSTPWSEPIPDITVESPEWISLEYDKFIEDIMAR